MKSFLALALLFAALPACRGCGPSPAPPPPPGPPTDERVYEQLVVGRCLAPSDAGAAALGAEHRSGSEPVWLGCLYAGGTILSCNVPCTPPPNEQ